MISVSVLFIYLCLCFLCVCCTWHVASVAGLVVLFFEYFSSSVLPLSMSADVLFGLVLFVLFASFTGWYCCYCAIFCCCMGVIYVVFGRPARLTNEVDKAVVASGFVVVHDFCLLIVSLHLLPTRVLFCVSFVDGRVCPAVGT